MAKCKRVKRKKESRLIAIYNRFQVRINLRLFDKKLALVCRQNVVEDKGVQFGFVYETYWGKRDRASATHKTLESVLDEYPS